MPEGVFALLGALIGVGGGLVAALITTSRTAWAQRAAARDQAFRTWKLELLAPSLAWVKETSTLLLRLEQATSRGDYTTAATIAIELVAAHEQSGDIAMSYIPYGPYRAQMVAYTKAFGPVIRRVRSWAEQEYKAQHSNEESQVSHKPIHYTEQDEQEREALAKATHDLLRTAEAYLFPEEPEPFAWFLRRRPRTDV